MGRYLIRRVLAAAFTLWVVATLLFCLLSLFPGGPFDEELAISPDLKGRLEEVYGVSGPFLQRYGSYLLSSLRGDFGLSLHFSGQTVSQVLARAWDASYLLGIGSLLFAVIAGFFLGLAPSLSPGWPRLVRGFCRAGLALPSLFLAPLLLWLLCFQLDLFPLQVDGTFSSFLLPIFLLGFRPACGLAKLLDVRMRESFRQDHARTFRSLGASENRLAWRWLLRASSVAFLQQLPQISAALLGGSLLIEPLFGIQGLGFQSVESFLHRDWSLAIGLTMFFSLVLILAQLLTDVLMLILDPRARPG